MGRELILDLEHHDEQHCRDHWADYGSPSSDQHRHTAAARSDSALTLGQMQCYRPLNQPRLRAAYIQARRLADQIDILEWVHHYRSHNKMADFLANQAMDSQCTAKISFPTNNRQLTAVTERLSNDFDHWISRHDNATDKSTPRAERSSATAFGCW